jgi:hypothetical protein
MIALSRLILDFIPRQVVRRPHLGQEDLTGRRRGILRMIIMRTFSVRSRGQQGQRYRKVGNGI